MQAERINLITLEQMPNLTGVAPNALIDKVIKISSETMAVEGWSTWDQSLNKTLYIYIAPGFVKANAYAYVRSDLSNRVGAKGFLLVAEKIPVQIQNVCLMAMSHNNFYSIAGGAC